MWWLDCAEDEDPWQYHEVGPLHHRAVEPVRTRGCTGNGAGIGYPHIEGWQKVTAQRSHKLIKEREPIFREAMLSKLQVGAEQYGDASLDKPLSALLAEVQAETVDIAGWGLLLWDRCERMKVKVAEIERLVALTKP
jgi:hypothetical protein